MTLRVVFVPPDLVAALAFVVVEPTRGRQCFRHPTVVASHWETGALGSGDRSLIEPRYGIFKNELWRALSSGLRAALAHLPAFFSTEMAWLAHVQRRLRNL